MQRRITTVHNRFRLVGLAAALVAALTAGACSSSSGSSTSSPTAAVTSSTASPSSEAEPSAARSPAATAAGSAVASSPTAGSDAPAPSSSGSVAAAAVGSSVPLSSIPAAVAANYTGYSSFARLFANAYAGWTPPKAPWKFCESTTDVNNSWSAGTQDEFSSLIKQLQAAKLATPDFTVDISNDNIALQISQTNNLVSAGCQVILSVPGSPTALCPAVTNAFHHGVLFVTDDTPIYCPEAINVSLNVYQTMFVAANAVMDSMGGKGNFLIEDGIPGAVDTAVKDNAIAAALKGHPGVTKLGAVVGDFSSSVAQAGTAQFLATHPQKIDGIIDLGGMGVAGELALQQAGRPKAKVNTYEAACSEIAYQHDNPGAVSLAEDQGPAPAAYETLAIAVRMLFGQRPVANTIFYPIPGPTDATINDWYQPTMNTKSSCFASAPSGRIIPDSYFNPLFTGGSPVSVQLNP